MADTLRIEYMDARLPERFWARVEPEPNSGCWLWTGGRHRGGYGGFFWNGRMQSAHRVIFEVMFGPVPLGFEVCHSCDTPPCVNPRDLFKGTRLDNMKDMMAKGRRTYGDMAGEHCPAALLTSDQVLEIRALDGQESRYSVAAKFGVSYAAVWDIQKRRNWRCLPG